MTVLGEYGHAIGGPKVTRIGVGGPIDNTWRERPEASEALGPVGTMVGRPPEHLPEQLDRDERRSSRSACPLSPNETEIWWFTFVDEATAARSAADRR